MLPHSSIPPGFGPRSALLAVLLSALLPFGGAPTGAPTGAAPPPARGASVSSAASSAASPAASAELGLAAEVLWFPPAGFPLEVLAQYRQPAHAYGPGHRGVDLGAPPGGTVASPVTGTVTFSGMVAGRSVVSIAAGERVVYSLEPVLGAPPAGTAVLAGDAIGAVAPGGHCSAGCLHLGVRVDGEYRDPMLLFAGRARLLPW